MIKFSNNGTELFDDAHNLLDTTDIFLEVYNRPSAKIYSVPTRG